MEPGTLLFTISASSAGIARSRLGLHADAIFTLSRDRDTSFSHSGS